MSDIQENRFKILFYDFEIWFKERMRENKRKYICIFGRKLVLIYSHNITFVKAFVIKL